MQESEEVTLLGVTDDLKIRAMIDNELRSFSIYVDMAEMPFQAVMDALKDSTEVLGLVAKTLIDEEGARISESVGIRLILGLSVKDAHKIFVEFNRQVGDDLNRGDLES